VAREGRGWEGKERMNVERDRCGKKSRREDYKRRQE
jgi:hypothetical protein